MFLLEQIKINTYMHVDCGYNTYMHTATHIQGKIKARPVAAVTRSRLPRQAGMPVH